MQFHHTINPFIFFKSATAEVYNDEGNDEYRRKEFRSAISFYTEAIKVNCKDDELNAQLHSNRATVYFYLVRFCILVLSDLTQAT